MIGKYRITANLMEVDEDEKAMATFADKDLDDATEWIKEQMKDDKNTIL